MKTFPHLIVCTHCDTVYRRPLLAAGEVARCEACAAVLCRTHRVDIDRWLALTVAAAIVFVMANVCPVIRIALYGQHNQITLWQAAAVLGHGKTAPIAVLAMLSVIAVPSLQILLLGWLLLFARVGRRAPGFTGAMRMLSVLRPWSMVEIALLGALVSLVKLSSFLEVTPGAGIWATAGLMVLITLVANRDIRVLWSMTNEQVLFRGAPA